AADDGTVLVCLPKGGLYGIQIIARGYLFVSESVEIPDGGDADHPFIAEYLLHRIEESKGKAMVLKNIYFTSGSAELSPVSDAELKVLAAMFFANPDIRVRINGHTDDVGSDEDNIQLSVMRANSVMERLIELGVSAKSLSAKGFGESVPIGDNTTEAGRKSNRRIEFEILP
ncbi:MAG TPA: OmpA family protein, partial [Saprospiraceae bacterium]|nr:OmpA family protein [Saprospiraceae bacterium]